MGLISLLLKFLADVFGAVLNRNLETPAETTEVSNVEGTANSLSTDELASAYGVHNRGEAKK